MKLKINFNFFSSFQATNHEAHISNVSGPWQRRFRRGVCLSSSRHREIVRLQKAGKEKGEEAER